MINIMTPGPTKVRENVRIARSELCTNPDLDYSFFTYYHSLCKDISNLFHTDNESFILAGEAMLGLEASVASLCEKEDRVLVISNGIFGRGFNDLVELYGGNGVVYESDPYCGIDLDKLSTFLKKDHNFKFATLVHCDTPSGVLNSIETICPLLHQYGILSVVDSVSAAFSVDIDIEKSMIDILITGSQKALSVPPGLTIVTISPKAFQVMENRKSKIASFYCNLLNFKDYNSNKAFPYTMPISDIKGLSVAIQNFKEDATVFLRHQTIAKATREAIVEYGLSLYLKDQYSPSVTVINVPDSIKCDDILNTMIRDHQIMIAGCFDVLKDKVIRIGHMGENAKIEDMILTLSALDQTLNKLGFKGNGKLNEIFINNLNKEKTGS
ncbi:MAG: alanine--glyoxylate aminotransferase family protein [Erysipelotrichaceae bacterium]